MLLNQNYGFHKITRNQNENDKRDQRKGTKEEAEKQRISTSPACIYYQL
jgi:hypothetical protein